MSARSGIVAFALVAVIGLGGLFASAATHHPATAFSLGVPATSYAPYLNPGRVACQGPIDPPTAFRGVRAWIWPGYPPRAVLRVTAVDLGAGTTLASGQIIHINSSAEQQYPAPQPGTASLDRTLPAGKRVSICFRNTGSTVINLAAGSSNGTSGLLTVNGQHTLMAGSLLFLRVHAPSLLSQAPTMFRRASLFRPRWVGEWTFWVLAFALLVTFPIAGLAVAKASRSPTPHDDRNELAAANRSVL